MHPIILELNVRRIPEKNICQSLVLQWADVEPEPCCLMTAIKIYLHSFFEEKINIKFEIRTKIGHSHLAIDKTELMNPTGTLMSPSNSDWNLYGRIKRKFLMHKCINGCANAQKPIHTGRSVDIFIVGFSSK